MKYTKINREDFNKENIRKLLNDWFTTMAQSQPLEERLKTLFVLDVINFLLDHIDPKLDFDEALMDVVVHACDAFPQAAASVVHPVIPANNLEFVMFKLVSAFAESSKRVIKLAKQFEF